MSSPNTTVSGTSPPTRTTAPPAPNAAKTAALPRPRKRAALRVPRSVRRAAGPVGLLAVWFLTSTTGVLPESVLASPVDVVRRAVDLTQTGELPQAIAPRSASSSVRPSPSRCRSPLGCSGWART